VQGGEEKAKKATEVGNGKEIWKEGGFPKKKASSPTGPSPHFCFGWVGGLGCFVGVLWGKGYGEQQDTEFG